MAEDQEVEPLRGDAALAGVDLPVGPVQPHAEDPDQDTPGTGNVLHGRLRDLSELRAHRDPRCDGDGLHGDPPRDVIVLSKAMPGAQRSRPIRIRYAACNGPDTCATVALTKGPSRRPWAATRSAFSMGARSW